MQAEQKAGNMARGIPKEIGLVGLISNANPAYLRRDMGDLEDLKRDIQYRGIEVPILIKSDYLIIDGARRFEAAKQLGWDWVPTNRANDFHTAMRYLDQAKLATGPLKLRMRWIEMDALCRDILAPLYEPVRIAKMVAYRRNGGPIDPRSHGSEFLDRAAALFDLKPLQMEMVRRVGKLYRQAPTGSVLQKYFDAIISEYEPMKGPQDKGVNRVYRLMSEAAERFAKSGSLDGPKPEYMDAEEQELRLARICQVLEGIGRELAELGPLNPAINTYRFDGHRKTLYRVVRQAGAVRGQIIDILKATEER